MSGQRDRSAPLATLVGALVMLGVATIGAALRVEPFHAWYYHWAWVPALIAVAAAWTWRVGSPPFSKRFIVSLIFWSAPVWFLFELINLRLANWYYVFAAGDRLVRMVAAFTAFATVLPAIYLVYRWLERWGLAGRWKGPSFELQPWHLRGVFGLGLVFLFLALWRPSMFFPLVWGSLTLLLEPWNHRANPSQSLLGDIERGSYGRIVQLLAAGAIVGLVWEAFNSLAGTRWIYTVPGLERLKLFEMPLLGFLGFPVFALDCFVIYQTLVNLQVAWPGWDRWPSRGAPLSAPAMGQGRGPRSVRAKRWPLAAAAALAFGIAVSLGAERRTIDSERAVLDDLPGTGVAEIGAIRSAGVSTVAELAATDAFALARVSGLPPARVVEISSTAQLVQLRGIGSTNAAALHDIDIRSVCDLADADPAAVSRAVRARRQTAHAGRPGRVRVWIRAAGRSCPSVERGGETR